MAAKRTIPDDWENHATQAERGSLDALRADLAYHTGHTTALRREIMKIQTRASHRRLSSSRKIVVDIAHDGA